MAWQKVTITPEQITDGEGTRLQDAFEKAFMTANAPDGVAMFGEHEVTDSFSYYFSPAAVHLFPSMLEAFGASDTTPPSRDEAALFVGHANAENMLPGGEG